MDCERHESPIWLDLTIFLHLEWRQQGDRHWETRWRIPAERVASSSSQARGVRPRLDGATSVKAFAVVPVVVPPMALAKVLIVIPPTGRPISRCLRLNARKSIQARGRRLVPLTPIAENSEDSSDSP